MKVVLVTGGFPDKENNLKGIFNKKAAIELSKRVELTVLHYRMLKPGRKLIERVSENDYNLIRISIPQIPFFNRFTICINTYLVQLFIKPFIAGYEVVHSVSGLTGVSVGRLKRKLEFKHVCQIIGGDANFILPQLKRVGCVKNLNNFDEIVCNSLSLKNKLSEDFSFKSNADVVYRGVDLIRFYPLNKKLKNEIVFLFIGGLVDYKHSIFRDNLKGGFTLMKAWDIVDKKINTKHSVKLLFGGANTSNNASLMNWKKRLVYQDRVEIIGQINPKDIKTIYNMSNVTIIPSQLEGFPNVGMESFAAGNCVIGSNAGGLPELIDEEVNGFIFEKGNAELLAQKILKMIELNIVSKFGQNARLKAEKNYNQARFAERYIKIYER